MEELKRGYIEQAVEHERSRQANRIITVVRTSYMAMRHCILRFVGLVERTDTLTEAEGEENPQAVEAEEAVVAGAWRIAVQCQRPDAAPRAGQDTHHNWPQ